ncbi:hypothetical protein M2R47_08705 [Moraxella sp. Tifton1]|nr:hypothetical protein [Moraxella sp. Tifton1]MCL1624313.1 hypothetical protein [Moraxella sp. Tifton1]
MFEITQQTHLGTKNENGKQAIHPYLPQAHPNFPVNRQMFNNDQTQYWKDRLEKLINLGKK